MKQIESYNWFETILLVIEKNSRRFYITIITCLIFHALTLFLILFFWLDSFDFQIIFTLIKGWVFSIFSPDKGVPFKLFNKIYHLNSVDVHKYITDLVIPHTQIRHKFILSVYSSFLSYLSAPILFYFFLKKLKIKATKEYITGSQLISSKEFNLQIMDKNRYLPFGKDIKLPVAYETKHLLLVGSTGSGKTVLLSRIINAAIKRKNNCVIYDYKGDYSSKFFNKKTDHLFNPLDDRCLKWNVFNDIENNDDIEAFSASLIPPAIGSDSKFWNDAARDVLTGIIVYLHQNNKKTNKDIWETITLDIKDIAELLKKTPGAERGYAYIQYESSTQALNIVGRLIHYTKSFEYLQHIDGSFSIRKWLQDPKFNIFVSNHSNTKDYLKPILSAFVDLMGRHFISLKNDSYRRVFFFLDDFGTLQHLPSILNLQIFGTSKGASVWIGIQDLGQLENIYGKDISSIITRACSNSVYLRVSDPITSQYLSDKIGKAVFSVSKERYSMGDLDNRHSSNLFKSEKTENLVKTSELMALKDLEGYVFFCGTNITKVKFPSDYHSASAIESMVDGMGGVLRAT
ncbi:type IV secretion system DNA-binding domain-containing protein [Desulforegula conservatrix]|uniref:type IV secretion system DNA-binding domain-containing protein n=1 Tax=Desulforegula conservatrix TaxID=153026 RepID=UPI0003F5C61F|nr:type IV secretion system DNA-binding domain-containing protein [Desulforegula conservatrix]